jgi:hypothetical protein
MSKRSFLLLAIVTLSILAAAWVLTQQRAPETSVQSAKLFPGFVDQVNNVAKLEVSSKEHKTVVVKQGDKWAVESRGNYPASFEMVKGIAMSMANLEIVEQKTNNKELYPRLGVEDVSTEGSASKLITLLDPSGKPLASLIIGKNRESQSDRGPAGFYVRRANEAQSWLVKGEMEVSANPTDWMDKTLFNIASDRVSEITIQHPGQKPLHLGRKDSKATDYTLDDVPAGFKIKSQVTLNGLATALEDLSLDDVLPQVGFTPSGEPIVTTFRTFDGLVVTATTYKLNDRIHARFAFSYDMDYAKQHQSADDKAKETPKAQDTSKPAEPAENKGKSEPKPSVEQEAASLNKKTKDWVYILPSYKADLLQRKQDELIASLKEDKPKTPEPPTK